MSALKVVLFCLCVGVVFGQGGRCPPPSGFGICADSPRCRQGFFNTCGRGRRCCRNGCGAYVCTNVSGGGGGGGVPPWCGRPRLNCFVNPCTLGCPNFPGAVCIPTNPCEPACTGVFYRRGRFGRLRQLSGEECRGSM